jgi:hypothetical protein
MHPLSGNGCRSQDLQFMGGLLALSDALRDTMGQPLECEHVASNGDVLQATSMGLAYQLAGSEHYFFTNGSDKWTLTDDGSAVPVDQ